MHVYADHAATTPLSEAAKERMIEALNGQWGNPSSLHSGGQRAKEALEAARAQIAGLLGAQSSEIYFTSGGSEADNQAILTALRLGARRGKKHIVTSAFEHHAVLHPLQRLEKEGYEVTWLPVHEDGLVRPQEVEAALREDTALVTIMYANNEIGTLQPIEEIGRICREKKTLFHTDAVQAVGHVPVDVVRDQVDMLSVSAHKFGGPKGTGLLYARRGILPATLIEGGAQEKGRRAGTENLPAILGMAAALQDACGRMKQTSDRLIPLRERLIEELSKIPHSRLNGDRTHRVPGTVNFCFEGIEGESLLLMLDDLGIEASSGSACTSGSLDPSHVLLALGLPHEVAHGSLRLSLGEDNTPEQIEYIAAKVPEVVAFLRGMSPVWEALEKGERPHLI